jgi:hypothetical protein
MKTAKAEYENVEGHGSAVGIKSARHDHKWLGG